MNRPTDSQGSSATENAIGGAASDDAKTKYLLDPYMDWAKKESIPIHDDFGHDLLTLETSGWDRYDARGCFAHTRGRGDFVANYILEILPTAKTRPIKHLYEAIYYVLRGYGSAVVWLPDGSERIFEWGPRALFSIPLNCTYQLFNASGDEPVRISCTNLAPLTFNLYHDERFVFENDSAFPARVGKSDHFEGGGEHLVYNADSAQVQNVWETNFVHDLSSLRLYAMPGRGKGSESLKFVLADGTMGAHVSEIPVGRYKKAHRHAAGTHVHAVDGQGYSLLWYEGDSDFVEIPWRHGYMYAPPFWMFHQHFNTCTHPARYLACSLGSRRYPMLSLRRSSAEGQGAVSVSEGGRQIEYQDQDPRIHRKFLEALEHTGVPSQMGDLFDEKAIMALPNESLQGAVRTPESIGPAE